MDEAEIREWVRRYIMEQFLDDEREELESETPLLELGILDSLAIVNLIRQLEATFSFLVPEEELTAPNFENVAAIARLVRRQLGHGATPA